jgi:hypothetical protein
MMVRSAAAARTDLCTTMAASSAPAREDLRTTRANATSGRLVFNGSCLLDADSTVRLRRQDHHIRLFAE